MKCDESDYPKCANCQHKELLCSWPPSKKAIYETLREIKYVGDDVVGGKVNKHTHREKKPHKSMSPPISRVQPVRTFSYHEPTPAFPDYKVELLPHMSYSLPNSRLSLPLAASVSAIWADKSSKNSMLNKIALQEECVEEQASGNARNEHHFHSDAHVKVDES